MFRGCTSLVTPPELPATTLANYCYSKMFNNCTSLKYIKCLATNIGNNTYGWVQNINDNGVFVKNSEATSWSRGISGIPEGWEEIDD